MVKLVCFDSSKLGPELIDNKLISFVPIIMIKNNGMTQMHGGGEKVRNREESKMSLILAFVVLSTFLLNIIEDF